MKTTTLFLILLITGLDLWAQTTPPNFPPNVRRPMPRRFGTNAPARNFPANAPAAAPGVPTVPSPRTAVSPANAHATPAPAAPREEMIPSGDINFQGVDVNQVLDVYAKLVNRTILRASLPPAQIVLKTETPLTKTEAIQALQAVLALNGISLVNVGDKFVKALPIDQANTAGAPFSDKTAEQLPDLGSYVTHIVQLKYVKPTEMVPIIQPFAKLPNSILPIDSNGILVLRDNAENVKRMLEMIAKVDVEVPEEIISDVIPIRYALAVDIANALNSLGNGGSTVTIGSTATTPGPINGTSLRGNNSFNGQNNYQNRSGINPMDLSVTPMDASVSPMALNNGTPTAGTTFQQRLHDIIQRASSGGNQQEQIQVLGTTKIIADQRSNSLLVFATKQDMARIKQIVAKLDVLLAQVLIESVIMDVGYNNAWNLGVSAAQNPKAFSPTKNIVGGGGSVNSTASSPFFDFLNNSTYQFGTNSGSIFGNVLPGGLSYFGNIGPTWNVALQAAASDANVTVIQRPRIQTSQAKPASFFVGQTVPYVTSTSYGGSIYGNQSSYSQLSVGVELDVTPFINPDGLVVMDINQEIDDLNGTTHIEGVGDIPNTTKRTLSSEIAVKDRDTIILGGFVRSDKSKSKSGVPLLEDIPILGTLFSQRSTTKDRDETLVLIRPTVLRTPDIAAAQTVKEEERLPGIAHAEADDAADAQAQIDAERKAELEKERTTKHSAGVFTVEPANPKVINTNTVPQPNPATNLY